jgi:hypothetical protein
LEAFFIEGRQFLDDDPRDSAGNRSGFAFVLQDLKSRPEDGVPDLFRSKATTDPSLFWTLCKIDRLSTKDSIREKIAGHGLA